MSFHSSVVKSAFEVIFSPIHGVAVRTGFVKPCEDHNVTVRPRFNGPSRWREIPGVDSNPIAQKGAEGTPA